MCEDWMRECPLCSVFLNLTVWLAFVAVFWCAVDNNTYNGVVSPQDLVALPAVIFILLYGFYLTECYFATSRKYLSHVLKGETIFQYIERIRSEAPVLSFTAACWHHETRQRQKHFTDRRGKTHTRMENYPEKVINFTDEEKFSFNKWEDLTVVPEDLQYFSLVKVSFTKTFELRSEPTKTLFTNLSCGFQARNRHRDKYMDYDEQLSINGFQDEVTAYVKAEGKEKWATLAGYWVFSLLLCSWVFRWMLQKRTAHREVRIVKGIVVCSV